MWGHLLTLEVGDNSLVEQVAIRPTWPHWLKCWRIMVSDTAVGMPPT